MDRDVSIEILKRLQFDLSHTNVSNGKFMIRCIDHTDRKPSCSVDIDKGIYHCFSCLKSGALTSLYYEHFGHSIYQDLGLVQSNVDSQFRNGFRKPEEKIDYELVPDNIVEFKGEAVRAWQSITCRKYLESRGVTKEVSENMNMWFALRGKVVDKKNSDETDNFIYYNNRLMIPIKEQGLTLSIEGRDVLGKELYKGDPDTYKKVLYPKGSSTSTLFQLEKLKKTETLYFTEGLMDLAPLRVSPRFKNSTAVFGASISHRQVFLLNKFTKLVDLLDNDFAGWTALLHLGMGLELLEPGSSKKLFYVIPPPGCKDVGDIFQKLSLTIDGCYDRQGFAREHPFDKDEVTKIVERLKKEKVEKEKLAKAKLDNARKELAS